MTYKAVEVSGLPESPPAILIESTKERFPPSDISNVVISEIALWEVDSDVGGYFSWSYWRSLFDMKRDYNVILHQIDPLTDKTQTFLLHSTDDLEVAKEALKKVSKTLTPLVDDCTLLLTEKLLKHIILPVPVKPFKLARHLAEVMELDPSAHPDWVKVLQALELAAIGQEHEGHDVVDLGTKKSRKELINQCDKAGMTPLYSAFQQNNHEVVAKLICAGAELGEDEDGSNPFHLAAESGSAESIGSAHYRKDHFLQKESSKEPEKRKFLNALNAPNRRGFTPLMISVCKDFVNSTVSFLQAGADPNIPHSTTGDTALHIAAKRGHVSLLKALLTFGAEMKVNKANSTPLDTARASKAKDAKECVEVFEEIIKLKKEAASRVSDKFVPVDVPPNSIFLLSMDGGGTRGLLLTQTLLHIQRRMKELKPDSGPVHQYFDYVAGTSAGGLATLSLVCAGASVEATRASFFKAADEICSRKPTFPDNVVSITSQQTFGINSLMSDIEKPRAIVPTVLADRNPPELHLMCNYGGARNKQKPPSEWKVWEAGRSTSAAPFYFPPYLDKFVDGGVMSNNPTLDAMSEIVMQEKKEGTDRKLAMVVSIGTGLYPKPTKVKHVGMYVPHLSSMLNITGLPNLLSAVTNFLHLLIAQATVSNGQETIRAEAWCESLGIPYHRFSTPLDKIVDLTENDKEVLTDMMHQCDKYLLKEKIEEIDEIARYLLSRHSE